MMNKSTITYRLVTLVTLAIVSFSCSSIEIFKEKTEIKPARNYQTFVIVNKEVGQKGFVDTYLDAMVSETLQNELEERGMVYDAENPEVVIRYTSNEDLRQKEVYPSHYPMFGWRVWDPWMFDPRFGNQNNFNRTKNYELMQLIVDFIDPQSDKMLMRLTAVSEVHNQKEKGRKAVRSVEKVVSTYSDHIVGHTL